MKDIKTAEEVFKEWVKDKPIGAITPTFDGSYLMDRDNAIIFAKAYAEYYHKAKVEGISDDEINQYLVDEEEMRISAGKGMGIDWFKNKLLNDL